MSHQVDASSVVECREVCWWENQLGEMVTHWSPRDIVGHPLDSDIMSYLVTNVVPQLINFMTLDAEYVGSTCQIIYPVRLPETINRTAAANGAATSPGMGRGVAGLLSLYADKSGQPYRGRKYVPFPSAAFNSASDSPTGAALTILQSIADSYGTKTGDLGATGNTAKWQPVIWHRKAGTKYPTLAHTYDDIVVDFPEPYWGHQIRRSPTGRQNLPTL